MLNKRVKTFLTLMLAGAMVLSEPAASWAASEEAGQTESTKSGTEDSEKEEKSADKKEDKSTKKKKKASGNSASSDDTVSKSASFSRVLSKASAAPEEEPGEMNDEEDDKADEADKVKKDEKTSDDTETTVQENENEGVDLADDEELGEEDVSETDGTSETDSTSKEETPVEPKARYADPFSVGGGINGIDYLYSTETGVLTVSTNKTLSVTGNGKTTDGSSISVNSAQSPSLSLNGLHITTSANSAINVFGNGQATFYLGGDGKLSNINILNGKTSSIQIAGGNVTIDGSGVLSGNKINGTVRVKGGNILAPITNPVAVSGNEKLEQQIFPGLSANALYTISGNSGADYKDRVYSTEDGRIGLYLPKLESGYSYSAETNGRILNINRIKDPTPTNTPSPSPSPSGTPVPDKANEADNGLYYIDSNTTYRSGATLQFYATGAGYGPEEPQELNPVEGSTRYIPTDWKVSTTSSSVSSNGSSAKGSWTEYSEETTGRGSGDSYIPGEYRYKGSFLINTTGTSSVPFTLQVNYNRQTYRADGTWIDDGTTASKSVNFYIRNTTATVTNRPSTTPYIRSTVTTSATRSGISTNARNAATGDETPIGTLVLLLAAAAISGTAIFRKKRMRQ